MAAFFGGLLGVFLRLLFRLLLGGFLVFLRFLVLFLFVLIGLLRMLLVRLGRCIMSGSGAMQLVVIPVLWVTWGQYKLTR